MGKKLSGSFMHIDKVSHYHVVKFAKKIFHMIESTDEMIMDTG